MKFVHKLTYLIDEVKDLFKENGGQSESDDELEATEDEVLIFHKGVTILLKFWCLGGILPY